MWPGGAFGSRGRIAAGELPEPGRVVVLADAPEWREVVAEAFDRDRPAPEELTEACVRLLARWRSTWSARPEVVVDLAAAGYPRLVGSVADHLAAVGRLDRASLALPGAAPDVRDLSSADEAARWRELLTPVVPADAVRDRAVLLVVDATSSLWPITVASALLRRAEAQVVLPLLLHRRP